MLAAVGEQSDKPLVSTFLGREGVPELLRVPDVAGSHRRPRLGAVVPRGRGRGPGAGAGGRVRRVAAAARRARRSLPRTSTPAAAKRLVNEFLMQLPRRAASSTRDELTSCSAATASSCGSRSRSRRREAIAAGERLGWDVVLKATAEQLRERPDLAHVWRNIDDADGDARRLGHR